MVYICSCNIKFLISLITNKGIIFLIVGSGNIGPAVAGPVPTPLIRPSGQTISTGTVIMTVMVKMATTPTLLLAA